MWQIQKYISKWNIREEEYSQIVLTDVMDIYIIELPKFKRYKEKTENKEKEGEYPQEEERTYRSHDDLSDVATSKVFCNIEDITERKGTQAALAPTRRPARCQKTPRAPTPRKTDTNKSYNSYVSKIFYANDTRLNRITKNVYDCTDANHTMLVLDNDLTTIDQTNSGGIKLYRIRMWDESDNLIHDYQPVAAGTNICGTIAATNAMWDFVDKKLYYPAGTGSMGYGVDQ